MEAYSGRCCLGVIWGLEVEDASCRHSPEWARLARFGGGAFLQPYCRKRGERPDSLDKTDRQIGSDRLMIELDNCGLFDLEHNKFPTLDCCGFLDRSCSGARLVSITQVLFTRLVTGPQRLASSIIIRNGVRTATLL
jgi:hypothetical protein